MTRCCSEVLCVFGEVNCLLNSSDIYLWSVIFFLRFENSNLIGSFFLIFVALLSRFSIVSTSQFCGRKSWWTRAILFLCFCVSKSEYGYLAPQFLASVVHGLLARLFLSFILWLHLRAEESRPCVCLTECGVSMLCLWLSAVQLHLRIHPLVQAGFWAHFLSLPEKQASQIWRCWWKCAWGRGWVTGMIRMKWIWGLVDGLIWDRFRSTNRRRSATISWPRRYQGMSAAGSRAGGWGSFRSGFPFRTLRSLLRVCCLECLQWSRTRLGRERWHPRATGRYYARAGFWGFLGNLEGNCSLEEGRSWIFSGPDCQTSPWCLASRGPRRCVVGLF